MLALLKPLAAFKSNSSNVVLIWVDSLDNVTSLLTPPAVYMVVANALILGFVFLTQLKV